MTGGSKRKGPRQSGALGLSHVTNAYSRLPNRESSDTNMLMKSR
jgi:hypothetical protein